MITYIVRVANTPRLLLAWILGTLIIGASGYALAEGSAWGVGLWWGIVTMFTVGYGDQYPETVAGSMIAVGFMVIMWLLLAVISPAALAAKLIVDSDAWTDREQEEVKTLLRRAVSLLEEGERRAGLSGVESTGPGANAGAQERVEVGRGPRLRRRLLAGLLRGSSRGRVRDAGRGSTSRDAGDGA